MATGWLSINIRDGFISTSVIIVFLTSIFSQNRCKEYKGYSKSQNYPAEFVDKQFDKALSISRSELSK